MGLKQLPAEFAQYTTHILWDYLNQFVAVYFNDIIMFSKDQSEYTEHVWKVMSKLYNIGLSLNIDKYKFDVTKVEYLGLVFTPEGLKIPTEKVNAILDWLEPMNMKEVQGFLGITRYVRRFLEGYLKIAAPLTKLLRDDEPFVWKNEQQQAFYKLKELVKAELIIQIHDPEKENVMKIDASGDAHGLVLEQSDNTGRLRPVAFYSRKFTSAEQNYDTHDRELLAIVEGFRK